MYNYTENFYHKYNKISSKYFKFICNTDNYTEKFKTPKDMFL